MKRRGARCGRGKESGYHSVRRSMVKRRKRTVAPPPSGCPLGECMRLLGSASAAHVIWYLSAGERCCTELHPDIGDVSPKVLTASLRKLQREGVVKLGEAAFPGTQVPDHVC